MRSFLTRYVRGKRRTLKYEFAVFAVGLWGIYGVRILLSGDPAWIAAQGIVWGGMHVAVWGYVAAAVGLQVYQNRTDDTPPAVTAEFEDGEPRRPPDNSPEAAARGVV